MQFGKMLRGGAALLLACLLASSRAFEPVDICRVVVKVLYTGGPLAGDQLAFSIDGDEVTGGIDLQPGDFQITVEGRLCSDDATNGYVGTSATVTLAGDGAAPQSIKIIALDQEVFGPALDQSVDQPPIIVQVSVVPARVKVDETSAISFQAIDPIAGSEPASYVLSMGGAGDFSPADKACGAGNDCQIQYTARAGDTGNLPFSMEVADAGGLTDTVVGALVVDATGGISLDVQEFHKPIINTVSASTQTVLFGNEQAISIPVTDIDLFSEQTDPIDSLTLQTVVTEVQNITEGAQGALDCSQTSFTLAESTTGDITTFTLTWKPWDGVTGTAGDFGESWCKFAFIAVDSQGQESRVVEFTMAAVGTFSTGFGFGQLPLFETTFVETFSPAANQNVTLTMIYHDPDSTVTLAIDDGGLSSAANPADLVAQNCPVASPCETTIHLIADGTPGSHTVTLTLTDDDNGRQDVKQISFDVQAAGRKRRSLFRRSEQGGTYDINLALEDSRLEATVDHERQSAGTANNNNNGGGGGGGGGGGHNGDSDSQVWLIVSLVGVACVVIVAVGSVVTRRRGPAPTPLPQRGSVASSRSADPIEPEFEEISTV